MGVLNDKTNTGTLESVTFRKKGQDKGVKRAVQELDSKVQKRILSEGILEIAKDPTRWASP